MSTIPVSECPTAYDEQLPDSRTHFAWYCERARELIAAGHLAHALTLLHRLPPDIGVGRALLERAQSFEKSLECIRELLMQSAADADLDGTTKEVLSGVLRRFTFRDFERYGISGLLNLVENGATRQRLVTLLFKSGSYGDRLDEGLSLLPGCGKAKLEPFLALRLSPPPMRSLRRELETLRADPPTLKRRINRLLSLLVKQRELVDLDLASWNEINAYEEFAMVDCEIDIETLCLSELEALQDRI